MAGKRVLMVLTSNGKFGDTGDATGWYLPEAAHPYEVFTKAGVELTWASIEGGAAPLDASSVEATKDDEVCKKFLSEHIGLTKDTIAIADAKAEDYDAVYYVGGFGTMWDFPDNKASQKLIKTMYESNKIVAAVCHGPVAFVNVTLSDGTPLLKGKKCTAFSNAEEDAIQKRDSLPYTCEDKMSSVGGDYSAAALFQCNVQVDGKVMTGQNPASGGPLAQAIVDRFSIIFADIDACKEAGADEHKTFDDDACLGEKAPAFDKLDYLNADAFPAPEAGKPTVFVIWAQYHKPGYKFLPLYSQLNAKYGGKVNFVAVSCDPNNSYAKKFLDDPNKKYSTVFKTEMAVAHDVDRALTDGFVDVGKMGSMSPPHMFLLDAEGTIVWHQDHSELGAELPTRMGLVEQQIDLLLKGEPLVKCGNRPVEESDSDEESEEEEEDYGDLI